MDDQRQGSIADYLVLVRDDIKSVSQDVKESARLADRTAEGLSDIKSRHAVLENKVETNTRDINGIGGKVRDMENRQRNAMWFFASGLGLWLIKEVLGLLASGKIHAP